MKNLVKRISTATPEIKRVYQRYKKSNLYSLYQVYAKPSRAKCDVYDYILDTFLELEKSNDLKIISYNKFCFTAGFVYEYHDVLFFVHFTPSATKQYLVSDLTK